LYERISYSTSRHFIKSYAAEKKILCKEFSHQVENKRIYLKSWKSFQDSQYVFSFSIKYGILKKVVGTRAVLVGLKVNHGIWQ